MSGKVYWWQSRTIWFGLAQALVGVIVALGYLTDESGQQLLGYLDHIVGLVIAALAVGQIQGRWTATKEIKPDIVPNPTDVPGDA